MIVIRCWTVEDGVKDRKIAESLDDVARLGTALTHSDYIQFNISLRAHAYRDDRKRQTVYRNDRLAAANSI